MRSQNPSEMSSLLQSELVTSLQSHGCNVLQCTWNDGSILLGGKTCVAMMELCDPILAQLDEDDFDTFKASIFEPLGMIWLYNTEDPKNRLVEGFARTIRNEQPGINFHTMGVDLKSTKSLSKVSELVAKIVESPGTDNEYILKDDMLWIERIVEDSEMNQRLENSHVNAVDVVEVPLTDLEGRFDITFVDGPSPELVVRPSLIYELGEDLGSDEVEVETVAISLFV